MTPFQLIHEFHAATPALILEGYFDAALQAEQDRRVEVASREILELDDGPEVLRRVCKVVPRRQLPAIIRPLVPGDLSYLERIAWHKAADRIDMNIAPAVLGGRVEIVARYQVATVGEGRVRRVYEGEVTVDVRLIGRRIERGVIEDLERSLRTSATCTQEWLDRRG